MKGSRMGAGEPQMKICMSGIAGLAAKGTTKAAISSSLTTRLMAIELLK